MVVLEISPVDNDAGTDLLTEASLDNHGLVLVSRNGVEMQIHADQVKPDCDQIIFSTGARFEVHSISVIG